MSEDEVTGAQPSGVPAAGPLVGTDEVVRIPDSLRAEVLGDLLWWWTDGYVSVLVERLVLGEVGLRTLGGGVILTDDAARELAAVLLSAAPEVAA